jgi:hypothetical protein
MQHILGNIRRNFVLRIWSGRWYFIHLLPANYLISMCSAHRSCHSDATLVGTTCLGLQLAFDGSEDCGPYVKLPVLKSAMISNVWFHTNLPETSLFDSRPFVPCDPKQCLNHLGCPLLLWTQRPAPLASI